MAQYVDYSKLPRRELQALCKQHKIPANKTNVFMAESLDALLNNAPRHQEEFQEEEAPAPDSPEVEKVVEMVKGKRPAQKALLPEAELDSLAGLLANSSLEPHVQEEVTHQYATELQKASEGPVTAGIMTSPEPVVVAAKGRRGRPRLTKKEQKEVEEPAEVTDKDDSNMDSAVGNVLATEVGEESLMVEATEEWPKILPEAALEAILSPEHVVVPTKGRRGRPRLTKKEKVVEAPAEVTVKDDSSMDNYVENVLATEVAEESIMEELAEGSPKTFPEAELEVVASPVQADSTSDELQTEEPTVYGRTKNLYRKQDTTTSATDDVEEPDMMDEAEPDSASVHSEAEAEREETVPKPIEEEMDRTLEAEKEEMVREPIEEVMERTLEAEREMVPEPLDEVMERTLPPPEQEKKVRKPKKAGTKPRRNAQIVLEPEVKMSAATMDDVLPESISASAEVVSETEGVAPPALTVETEQASAQPVEEKKLRKQKKAGSRSRRNVEAEVEPEVEADEYVVPEVASYPTAEANDVSNDGEAIKSSVWAVPASILEEELPRTQCSFTESPAVLKEKPKTRKPKKASMKSRRNAEQYDTAVEDGCHENQGEPAAVETIKSVVASSWSETAGDMTSTYAEKENAEEPVTPMKKVGGMIPVDENLLSLSMRKLKETLKEKKKKGLQSRGTRALNL